MKPGDVVVFIRDEEEATGTVVRVHNGSVTVTCDGSAIEYAVKEEDCELYQEGESDAEHGR